MPLFNHHKLDRQGWLLALTGSCCVIAAMMNFLCMKPLSFGTSFVWMDGGLLISWIVFLITNVITEVYGKAVALRVTAIAAAVTFFVSCIAALEVYIPTLPAYSQQALHFAYVFHNGPRTILASAIAFYVGTVVKVEGIDRLRQRLPSHAGSRGFVFRAVASTIVGQLVDNTLFETLAFAPVGLSLFEMRWHDIATAVLTSTATETLVEAAFVPILTLPLTRYLLRLRDDAAA